jgi:hypothetical protein
VETKLKNIRESSWPSKAKRKVSGEKGDEGRLRTLLYYVSFDTYTYTLTRVINHNIYRDHNDNDKTKTHDCTHMPSNVPACELLFNFAMFSCEHNRESSKNMPSLSTCLDVVLLHVCTCYFCNRYNIPKKVQTLFQQLSNEFPVYYAAGRCW